MADLAEAYINGLKVLPKCEKLILDALECDPLNIRFHIIHARLQYAIHRYTKAYQILKPLLK